MKKFFAMAALVAISFGANAQSFEKGTKMLNLGVGIAPTFGTASISGFGFETKWSLPIGASFEIGISDRISVGAIAGIAN
jgi:hypothetical protein